MLLQDIESSVFTDWVIADSVLQLAFTATTAISSWFLH